MDIRTVLHILGRLVSLLAIALCFPLVAALIYDDPSLPFQQYETLSFFVAITAATVVGLGLRSVFDVNLARLGHREGAAIVTLSWAVFSLFGCLPFVVSGAASFTDAYYETMSGFTTTGASIFSDVEVLPHGLQLWRCLTQWLGGMGIVVLSVAVLPMLGAGGYRMFKAEAPGGSTFQRNAPRIKDTAKLLWIMYLVLTCCETLLLWLGGMSPFDALCHAFTTMSTGGFSTRTASLAGWPSPGIQWTIIVFMFVAGMNFEVHQQIVTGNFKVAIKSIELRVFAATALIVTVLTFAVLLITEGASFSELESTLRKAAFQVLSIGTTTGYGSADFNRWHDLLRLTLLLLMFVGGCAGSTAGGMKIIRLIIFVKSSLVELLRSINPRAIRVVRLGDRALTRETVANVMSFLAIWMGIFAIVTYVLTAMGLDLISAASAAAANLGNIGPGLGSVGPTAHYGHVPTAGKWLLVISMLLGRLELYSVLVLFLRKTWVR